MGAAAQAASFERTGSMSTVRIQHTATLLPDGRVLVAGGWQYYLPSRDAHYSGPTSQGLLVSLPPDRRALASVEVYEPATGTWALTGFMQTARCGHTATLLTNGLVLVAGGWNSQLTMGNRALRAVGSAELYDPKTGRWTQTGGMIFARSEHTATLLRSGNVLVTGGYSFEGCGPSARAEIYDPATGRWTLVGAQGLTRGGNTATLLRDGRVLLAGGISASGRLLSDALLFDPESGNWMGIDSMNFARSVAIAELLNDGRVFVAGGLPGSEPPRSITTAELYDPSLDTWSVARSMPLPIGGVASVLLRDGRVMVTGSSNFAVTRGLSVANAEVFDPDSGSWAVVGAIDTTLTPVTQAVFQALRQPTVGSLNNMAFTRDLTATELLNGRVLLAGGWNPDVGGLAMAEIFLPDKRMAVATSQTSHPVGGAKSALTGDEEQAAQIVNELVQCPSWLLLDAQDLRGRAQIVQIYERLNRFDTTLLRKGIAEYWNRYCGRHALHLHPCVDSYVNQSKVFPLIRVLFLVPDRYPFDDEMSWGGFFPDDYPEDGKGVLLSWPIENGPNGVPLLVGTQSTGGFVGPGYDGLRDFDFIAKHFPRRTLSKVPL